MIPGNRYTHDPAQGLILQGLLTQTKAGSLIRRSKVLSVKFAFRINLMKMLSQFMAIVALVAATLPLQADENIRIKEIAAGLPHSQAGSLLFLSQADRDLAFRHMADIYPTRKISAGPNTFAMPTRLRDLSGLTYSVEGSTLKLADYLAMPETKGFLVWQDGNILFEHYGPGHDQDTHWVSFSVAKSVTAMLIGAAMADGYIESVDEPITNYVPRFRGTDYEGASIKNVLQMASGVAWNEDYADPQSDAARAGGINGIALRNYLAELKRVAPPGEVFNYNTGETNLVGEILRSAIGNNAATYLTHKIWQPFGMGSDATWLLGSAGGGETGGCCINATLRDYARIGIFALNDGQLPDGTRVLPAGWMQASTRPSKGYQGYGYLWWLDEGGSYRARGIFGQQIYIDPQSRTVIAVHSNAQAAVDSLYHAHLEQVVAAVAGALQK